MGYARSPFRDFESYPKIVVGLDEEEMQWISKHHTAISGTFEIVPSIYSIKNFSEAVSTMGHHKGTLKIKKNGFGMKTKLTITRFGELLER